MPLIGFHMSVHIHIIYGIILFANGLQPSHSHFPFFSKDNKNRKKSRQFAVESAKSLDNLRLKLWKTMEESTENGLVAYEFKWNPAKAAKASCPRKFAQAYPAATWKCVSRENYVEFVTGLV